MIEQGRDTGEVLFFVLGTLTVLTHQRGWGIEIRRETESTLLCIDWRQETSSTITSNTVATRALAMTFIAPSETLPAKVFGPPNMRSVHITKGRLASYLLCRSPVGGTTPVFDVDRWWCRDAVCAREGTLYQVVVYLTFSDEGMLECQWEQMKNLLAVGAEVYHSHSRVALQGEKQEHAMLLLFDYRCPLVGPMSYAEVQYAVQHYLGFCPKLRNDVLPWKVGQHATVELVPQAEASTWWGSRQEMLLGCENKGTWPGVGFHCNTPCRADKRGV